MEAAVTIGEIVQLGAVDSEFYCRTWFPKAFRQGTPGFAQEVWRPLDNPGDHFVNLLMFRGSSKTTRLRAYTSKRIAYGMSQTILFVAASEGKVAASIKWLKRQIEHNHRWADAFQLRRGAKWTDTEIEIIHGVDQKIITVVGYGIGGPIRGINFDDWRPDLIVIDDVLTEDNASTPDGRAKIESLIYGALMNGLAPVSEAPDCKMVVLQTPMNRDDFAMKAANDNTWHTVRISCWTPETQDLPLEQQESSWEARWPSTELREKKRKFMARNMLSIWMREQEVRVISPELNSFRPEWLKEWDTLPEGLVHVLVIDPAPSPSDKALAKGVLKTDFEALGVIGVGRGKYYIREISVNRGHDPGWTVTEFFRLAQKYRIRKAIVETINYQRTLKWILNNAMRDRRQYYLIADFEDQRSKFQRIVDSLNGPASQGVLLFPPGESILGSSEGIQMARQQFLEYSHVTHDDALEVIANGVAELAGTLSTADEAANDDDDEEERVKPLTFATGALCP